MAQHVPAWKKLGLKLKFAKETADVAPVAHRIKQNVDDGTAVSNGSTKRSREDEPVQPETPAKKQKTRSKSSSKAQGAPNDLGISSVEAPPLDSTVQSNEDVRHDTSKALSRKKSVTFTPETKEEDGETGQIYFKTWAAENQQQPHTPPKPVNEQTVSENDETPVKVSTEPAAPSSTPMASRPKLKGKEAASAYVNYVEQFYNDKGNWKFNKSHQTALLKNMWNVYRIPPFLNDALVAYVAGLQGAAARQRLLEGADEYSKRIIEKTGGTMSSVLSTRPAEERRTAYEAALQQRLAQLKYAQVDESKGGEQKLEDLRREVEQERRAVGLLLGALMQDTGATQQPGPSIAPAPVGEAKHMKFAEEALPATAAADGKPKPKRKRKARTEVSSSSESSSSSSESDSSSHSD